MLGIQQPTDSLVVCKRALAEIDKLAQNNDQFPALYNAILKKLTVTDTR